MKPVNPYTAPLNNIHAEVQAAQKRLIERGVGPMNPQAFVSREERQAKARRNARARLAKKKNKKKRKSRKR